MLERFGGRRVYFEGAFAILGASFSAMRIGWLAFISGVDPDGWESELMCLGEAARGSSRCTTPHSPRLWSTA